MGGEGLINMHHQKRYAKPQIEHDSTRITRMHADTKSVRLIFICEISFPWDAPHIYNLLYIYIRALDIPRTNTQYRDSITLLISKFPHLTMCAVFAVMVVVLPVPALAKFSCGGWVCLLG